MIKGLFCAVMALMMIVSATANAAEPVRFEIRKRNSIGRLGVTGIHPTVKAEGDGSVVVSFQAPQEGTYILVYTNGPNKGKTAKAINVAKAGPVTTKITK